jgi:hypothetical protein
MALPTSQHTREFEKFEEDSTDSGVNVRVSVKEIALDSDGTTIPTQTQNKTEIVTGTGTSNGEILWEGDVSKYSSFGAYYTGGGQVTVYASNDQVTWFALSLKVTNSHTTAVTQVMYATSLNYAGEIHYKYLRFQITSYSSSITFFANLTTAETVVPSNTTVGVSGNVTAIGGATVQTLSGSALNAVVTANQSWYNYDAINFHLYGTFSATVSFEQSNDNSTWEPCVVRDDADTQGAPITSTTDAGNYVYNGSAIYIRARISSYTSGTVTCSVTRKQGSVPGPNFNKSLLGGVDWDYTDLTEAATTDTWTFKKGGSGGTTLAVVVITYTDSTKATIANVERTT